MPSCFLFLKMCFFHVSRLSKCMPRYLTSCCGSKFGLTVGFIGFLSNSWPRLENDIQNSVLSHGLHCAAWYRLSTVDFPLLPGLRPRKLAAISHQPPTLLTAACTQSCFTIGGLLSSSSSWRQAPSTSRPETISHLNPCGHSPYVTSSLTTGCVCLSWIDFASVSHRTYSMLLKIPFALYISPLKSRLWKADHAHFTYIMLQW
jgi:hypothetical protein